MKLLLDTHVWLWFVRGDGMLPERSRPPFVTPGAPCSFKTALAKLDVGKPIEEFLDDAVDGSICSMSPSGTYGRWRARLSTIVIHSTACSSLRREPMGSRW